MAIRKVARMGHPVLRQKAKELSVEEIRSSYIQNLIKDMAETMEEYGGVGIAAPQVHESVQVALIEITKMNDRYSEAPEQLLTVFINPKIKILDKGRQGVWEGCLSVPEMRGYVERPRKVKVDYLNEKAEPQSLEAEGFLSTVVQHELDHLDGVLYVDKIEDPTKLAFLAEYQKFWMSEAVAQDKSGDE